LYHCLRELQQPQFVRDGSSAQANAISYFFMRERKSGYYFMNASCNFHRAKIFTLEILDEREFQRLVIRDIEDAYWNIPQLGQPSRAPSSFAGYNLETILRAADEYGLYNSVLLYGGGKIQKPIVIYRITRLKRVRKQFVASDYILRVCRSFRRRVLGKLFDSLIRQSGDQGGEAFS
jgi:hypothetical protein